MLGLSYRAGKESLCDHFMGGASVEELGYVHKIGVGLTRLAEKHSIASSGALW